jgi:hypothetical protein
MAQQQSSQPRFGRYRPSPDFYAEELRASETDWRPLVSYTANLTRIGQELLGSDKAWRSMAQIRPPYERDRFLRDYMGPQYPWAWSGMVLIGLFVLSAGILNFRVRSLDRLK